MDSLSDLWSVEPGHRKSRRHQRGCRHKTVRKESPCCRRIVQDLLKIWRKSASRIPDRSCSSSPDGGSRRGQLGGRDEVCNFGQSDERTRSNMTDGLEQIGALTAAWVSLLFIAASAFGSILRLGRRMGGPLVRPTGGGRGSTKVGGRVDPEAVARSRSATIREYRDLFPSRLSGQNSIRFRRQGSGRPGDSGRQIAD